MARPAKVYRENLRALAEWLRQDAGGWRAAARIFDDNTETDGGVPPREDTIAGWLKAPVSSRLKRGYLIAIADYRNSQHDAGETYEDIERMLYDESTNWSACAATTQEGEPTIEEIKLFAAKIATLPTYSIVQIELAKRFERLWGENGNDRK